MPKLLADNLSRGGVVEPESLQLAHALLGQAHALCRPPGPGMD